jgi:hypothetical protein
MKKCLLVAALALVAALIAGCGGGNSPSTPIPTPSPASVIVSLTEAGITIDTSPDINAFTTHAFKAVVQNASDSTVIWKINGVQGGDGMTAHGSIDASGLYTSPAWIPSDSIVVSATSKQDPTKSASATVNLNWYVAGINLWSASGMQVATNGQLQVDAYVSTKGPQSVTWSINGVKIGSAALGALFQMKTWPNSVFYIAPPAKPAGPLTLTATSDANPGKSTSAAVTVTDAPQGEATLAVTPNEMNLELGKGQQFSATVTNTAGTPNWTVMEGEGRLDHGLMTGTGAYTAPFEIPSPGDVIVKATLAAYPTDKYGYAIVHVKPPAVNPNTQLNGNYVFSLHDQNYQTDLLGLLAADGNGNLSGTVDINTSAGVLLGQAFSGSYTMGADGRGTATITYAPLPGVTATVSAKLMLVSNNFAYVYSQDNTMGGTTGTLEKQTAATYGNTTLTGSYAFLLRGLEKDPPVGGSSAIYPIATAGAFTTTSGTLHGTSDLSGNGVLAQAQLVGAYNLTSNGHGNASLTLTQGTAQSISQFSFYMVSPSKMYLMSATDWSQANSSGPRLIGTAEQQSGAFSTALMNGPFVFYDIGDGWTQLGRFQAQGDGTLSSGVMETRDVTAITNVVVHSALPFMGSYAVDAGGRGTLDITAGAESMTGVFYAVSASKFFVLMAPGNHAVAAGEGFAQQNIAAFDWAAVTERYAVQMLGPMSAGTGWVLPRVWLGWLDYDGYVRNETSFDCYPPDSLGTGNMDIGFNNGTGLPAMRYHLVSDTKALAIYTFPTLEANEFVLMEKLQP